MEERVAYSVEGPQSHHHDVPIHTPGHPVSSFVVQVRKDQVYRVPPPDHARIEESFRKKAAAKKPKRKVPCLQYLFCLFTVLFVMALLLVVSIAIVFHSFNPKDPAFSVTSVVVKHKKGSPPTYDVRLKIKNPNPKMGIKYSSDIDDSKLSFGKRTISWGRFPELEHENGETTDGINIRFIGLKGVTLPPILEKSMSDMKAKNPVSLTLEIESSLVYNVWILKLWRKDVDVICQFRVDTFGEGTRILNQDCSTKVF
ncbi:hypothetical protein V6N13_112116 [Hibiscus sabdariffa]|uniref:Late embryogenesis abundant protein LEA-2 subgroup domain-containing protein n=1 Tax=Hibiscus sabdariffa TaxID=183260 RepID=A0ABR2TN62_9ROSI